MKKRAKHEVGIRPSVSLIRLVPEEFPPSTQYVKTLVHVKTSKISEFCFELTVTEGQLLEIDSEPMSSSLKLAVMTNGTLPSQWVVCLSSAGEKRLVRKTLIEKVEDVQARRIQLKEAVSQLIDSMEQNSPQKSEISMRIHLLVGTNSELIKFMVDCLLEAMNEGISRNRRSEAAHLIEHYMKGGSNEIIGYVETKLEKLVIFINDIRFDHKSSASIVNFVSQLMEKWCVYMKNDTLSLLVDVSAEKCFQHTVMKILQLSVEFQTETNREQLKKGVEQVTRLYFQKTERVYPTAKFLQEKLTESDLINDHYTISRIFYLCSFIFNISESFKKHFLNSFKVQNVCKKYIEIFDSQEEFKKWFPLAKDSQAKEDLEQPVPQPRNAHLYENVPTEEEKKCLPQPKPRQPPVAVLPLKAEDSIKPEPADHFQPPPQRRPPPVLPKPVFPQQKASDLPPPPQMHPKPRKINELKRNNNRRSARHYPQDPNHFLTIESQKLVNVMGPYLTSYNESALTYVTTLGEGSFGEVLLKQARGMAKPVAVKQMIPGNSVTENLMKEQANLLKCVFHQHIVRIEGKVVYDSKPDQIIGIVMEYMEGGSMHDLIYKKKEDYNEFQLLTWIQHATNALCFLHSKNLVHRDIKPSNMLLDRDRILKLGDFGMMRTIRENDSPKTLFGTDGYRAPEMDPKVTCLGGGEYSTSLDIYSFGVTIWELTQKKRPDLENRNSTDSRYKEYTRPSLAAPKYPWMPDIVTNMWSADPTRRATIEWVDEEVTKLVGYRNVEI